MDRSVIAVFIFVIPVVLGIGTEFFRRWLKHKEAMAELLASDTAEHASQYAAQYAAQVNRLEQRVQVLERIVTDRSTLLAEDIEKLREAPLN